MVPLPFPGLISTFWRTLLPRFLSTFLSTFKSSFLSTFWPTFFAKMAAFAILIALLRTWTSEAIRLSNYIPTLQVQTGGRNDIVESYFRLGLDYTEILLYLVLFHGIILSRRQLKGSWKTKDLYGSHKASLVHVLRASTIRMTKPAILTWI